MPSRDALHELIDTLPEAALESTQQILEGFQTWPPTPPVSVEQLRERVDEMLKTRADKWRARSGKSLSGSSFSLGNFKPDGDGMASMHTTDGPALVTFEIRIFHGYRLERKERLCLSDDENLLLYSQQINGPDGKENRYEMEFNVSEGHLPVNSR
jgi:hypothetical protein